MDWTTEQISIGELTAEVEELDRLDKEADAKKKIYSEAYQEAEAQRAKVLSMLQASGQSKFFAEGIGTVSQAIKVSVKVPATSDDRKLMLEWFKSQGEDVYLAYATVNSQSLNSLIRKKCEEDPSFTIPGVGERTEVSELRFRRSK